MPNLQFLTGQNEVAHLIAHHVVIPLSFSFALHGLLHLSPLTDPNTVPGFNVTTVDIFSTLHSWIKWLYL